MKYEIVDLDITDLFEFDGQVFMKIQSIMNYNCVNMSTGVGIIMGYDTPVLPLEGQLSLRRKS